MNRAPFASIAISFIAGILFARHIHISFAALWACAAASCTALGVCKRHDRIFVIFILFCSLFLGASFYRNAQILPVNHIARFISSSSVEARMRGVIVSDPIKTRRYMSFIIRADKLEKEGRAIKVCGDVMVKIRSFQDLAYGDSLWVRGKIYKVPRFRISGRLDYRDYLKQYRIYGIMSVGKDLVPELLGRGEASPFVALCYNARSKAKKVVEENMAPVCAGIVNAVMLGDRQDLPTWIRDVMVQTGTIHIVAISGLHVGLVGFIVFMLMKALRLPRKACYAIMILALAAYCVLTGASIPVVRSTIMAVVVFFGYLIDRRTETPNALAFAALLHLFYNPYQLFNISFQLSFVSIMSIVALAPPARSFIESRLKITGRLRAISGLFASSCAAWAGLLPFTSYYFDIISPIAIIANMIVIPYFTIVVGSSTVAIMSGFLSPAAAHILFSACEAAIIFLIWILSAFVRIPGSYFRLSSLLPPGF